MSGLSPATRYNFEIKAANGVGDSDWSPNRYGHTKPGRISTPSLTAGNGSLDVIWSAPSGGTAIESYQVRHKLTSASTWTSAGSSTTLPSTTLPFTITGLTNGSPYHVQVRACNRMLFVVGVGHNCGAWSSSATGTPQTVVPPAPAPPVTGPSVTISADPTSVDEGDSIEFTVRADAAPSSDLEVNVQVTQLGSFISGAPPAKVTINANDTQASFTVDTEDDSVEEASGFVIGNITRGTSYSLGRPSSASVAVLDNDTANLVVDPTTLTVDEAGDGTFTVKLATQPTGDVAVTVSSSDTMVARVSPVVLAFTTSSWKSAQTVTVSGVNDANSTNETATVSLRASGGGYANKTAAVSVSVTDDDTTDPPNTPLGVSVAAMIGNRGLFVTWQPVMEADGYEVETSPRESSHHTTISDPMADIQMAEVIGLVPGTTYSFRVRAWRQHNNTQLYSPWTHIVSHVALTPKHWWGHQADHIVKYMEGDIGNIAIEGAILRARDDWNTEMLPLGRGFLIIAGNINDFEVEIRAVNNNNDSRGRPPSDPEQGCGWSFGCVKRDGLGSENTSAAPGRHMERMYMVIEDPPITVAEDEHGNQFDKRWEWHRDHEIENDVVLGSNPMRYYAYIDRVILHEFGHTLGLPDYYNDASMRDLVAVMDTNNEIMPDDTEQLRAIYHRHNSH